MTPCFPSRCLALSALLSLVALTFSACSEDSSAQKTAKISQSNGAIAARMNQAKHGSVHLFTTGRSGAQVAADARKIKKLVLGDPSGQTCWQGPQGKAQLAIQTEFIPTEFINYGAGDDALALLDDRLDALNDEGLPVHLLLTAHQIIGKKWHDVDFPELSKWKGAGTFVPYQPCAKEDGPAGKCAYDVIANNFYKPVIEHLVKTGRAERLAVIFVLNEPGYDPGTPKDSAADWGGDPEWKQRRAEALAYTTMRVVTKAHEAAAGVVPIGVKFANVLPPSTGWAPVNGTDQLSFLLNDVLAKGDYVLGYDVYFGPGNYYDTGNKKRFEPFLSKFAPDRFEIAEFGRVCEGSPGKFASGSRTTPGDITGAAKYWGASGINVFAFNATGSPGGCYAWTDESGSVLPGATEEAHGLWNMIQESTGTKAPKPCTAPAKPSCSEICASAGKDCGSFQGCNCGSCTAPSTCSGYVCKTPSCDKICSSAGKNCGSFQGCNCGSCTAPSACSGNVCKAPSCSEICASAGKNCGSFQGCDCGSCTAPSTCSGNVCKAPSCSEICASAGKDCGSFQGCNCGSCTAPSTCSGYVCKTPSCDKICSSAGKNCGSFQGCNCGSCTAPSACSGNVCKAPSCSEICASAGKNCGSFQGCDCGSCTAPSTCSGNVCKAPSCSEICASAGKDCGSFQGCDCGSCTAPSACSGNVCAVCSPVYVFSTTPACGATYCLKIESISSDQTKVSFSRKDGAVFGSWKVYWAVRANSKNVSETQGFCEVYTGESQITITLPTSLLGLQVGNSATLDGIIWVGPTVDACGAANDTGEISVSEDCQ